MIEQNTLESFNFRTYIGTTSVHDLLSLFCVIGHASSLEESTSRSRRGGKPRRRTAAADKETNEGLSPATDQMSHRSCLSMQTDQGCCNTLNDDERGLEPFSIALFAYLVY
jgi:hypothetical protein